MAFEEALLQGFHGSDPDEVWMGPATATRFCRAVEDLLAILMDRMTTRDRHTLQLFTRPAFPELKATGHRQRPEYWTGVLGAGWRRTALAAIIQLCAREWMAARPGARLDVARSCHGGAERLG